MIGLRGAIAYALSLHLEFKEETRKVLVTTTLGLSYMTVFKTLFIDYFPFFLTVVVLFTTIILGGGTMPLMKYLERKKRNTRRPRRRGRKKEITMSKTREVFYFKSNNSNSKALSMYVFGNTVIGWVEIPECFRIFFWAQSPRNQLFY